ncbi:MAG: hypothetical protein E3J72_03210 [Planctomycetota bacterium]|nr:MAG: hypothetical protein E3J72_03210 [Planctomycetota bacterium]
MAKITDTKMNLSEIFNRYSESFLAVAKLQRESTDDPNAKGFGLEEFVRRELESFLGTQFSIIPQATLITKHGDRSNKIDITIADKSLIPHFPVSLGERYIPVEAVSATIEITQEYYPDKLKNDITRHAIVGELRQKNKIGPSVKVNDSDENLIVVPRSYCISISWKGSNSNEEIARKIPEILKEIISDHRFANLHGLFIIDIGYFIKTNAGYVCFKDAPAFWMFMHIADGIVTLLPESIARDHAKAVIRSYMEAFPDIAKVIIPTKADNEKQ